MNDKEEEQTEWVRVILPPEHKYTPRKEEPAEKVKKILAALGGIVAGLAGANLPPSGFSQPIVTPTDHIVVTDSRQERQQVISQAINTSNEFYIEMFRCNYAEDVHDFLEIIADLQRRQWDDAMQADWFSRAQERQWRARMYAQRVNETLKDLQAGQEPAEVDESMRELQLHMQKCLREGKTVDEAWRDYEPRWKEREAKRQELIEAVDKRLQNIEMEVRFHGYF